MPADPSKLLRVTHGGTLYSVKIDGEPPVHIVARDGLEAALLVREGDERVEGVEKIAEVELVDGALLEPLDKEDGAGG